ncbi:YgiW/YdeI family stress tolerance OB fold protein [Ponticaulis sp.]|uniref:YgiW/YdeI family stress tolerance OB fold protein n=1 Tax=Ponticaulis sp. TaxID=2020902 RepID=UPI000B70E40C|nr:NirD/YgiW/YdeI family stress tolerance protein [Ponticaulis sp.]MAI90338.1 hypothetical protein [Ponticaulis sp.]OUX99975.1 MAG: hypothetical protein CBB65_07850 [Hyphomonadaceae bacterium TMED5]|tara:strand:+ start:311000 stop:311362 length:363 start_codon:yes stop_codon:yes gene_type:complete
MNTRVLLKVSAAIGIIGAVTATASAQYTGPSSSNMNTVSDVLADPRDDAYVQLQGTINEQVGDEKYIFADATGEIRVEIDNDRFTSPVTENSVVEIRGEVEKDFMESPEIDVESLSVITP